ncbi:MAG: VUT family protein [bacterium]
MILIILMYLSAIVLANLTVSVFGPRIAVLNAFLFIGLDLTARDRLHEAWRGNKLVLKMAGLIATGSLLSYVLSPGAGPVALASLAAFALAATVDAVVYHLLGGFPRWLRINGSNVPSAAVDSFVFPALAFGFPLLWDIVFGQFAAKVLGGFCWTFVLTALVGQERGNAFKHAGNGRHRDSSRDLEPPERGTA